MSRLLLPVILLISMFSFGQCIEQPQMLNARYQRIEYFDVNHAIAFGMGTMIVTDDAGATWSFVPLPTAIADVETLMNCAILDENTAIISGYNGALYKTADKGHTWNTLSTGINQVVNFTGLSFVNSQTGYMFGFAYTDFQISAQRYLLKTNDGGQTWQQMNTNLWGGLTYWAGVNLKFIDEMHGFAWVDNVIYKTENGGISWNEIDNPGGIVAGDSPTIANLKTTSTGLLVMCLAASPCQFYTSSDIGETWQKIEALTWEQNVFIANAAFDIFGNTLYCIEQTGEGFDESLIKYNLTTATYTSSPISQQLGYLSDINMVTQNAGIILERGYAFWYQTPGRKMLKTTNSGNSWHEIDSFSILSPGSNNNITIRQNSENKYTLTKQDQTGDFTDFYLFTSSDNGATWQKKVFKASAVGTLLKAEGDYISYVRKNLSSSSLVLSLFESYDFGETWVSSTFHEPTQTGASPSFCSQLNDNTLKYELTNNLNFSIDKGQTWTHVTLPQISGITIVNTACISISELYCWGMSSSPNSHYYLYKSTNGGQNWQQVTDIPNANFSGSTVIGDEIAFVSTGNDDYYTVNLNDGTYEQINFTNIITNGISYVPQGNLSFINDDLWLFEAEGYLDYNYVGISDDHGVTWSALPCIICGPKFSYNSHTSELLSYSIEDGTERIETGLPSSPGINGNINVELGSTQTYVLSDALDTTEWLLNAGGSLSVGSDGQSATINWTTPGTYVLMARNINECGRSPYTRVYVNVSPLLSVTENTIDVDVYPNPFDNGLSLRFDEIMRNETEVEIVTLTGQIVYKNSFSGQEALLSLGNLNAGTYFLIIDSGNGKLTKKIIKR